MNDMRIGIHTVPTLKAVVIRPLAKALFPFFNEYYLYGAFAYESLHFCCHLPSALVGRARQGYTTM